MMNNHDVEKWLSELRQQVETGQIDYNTFVVKIARRTLNESISDFMFQEHILSLYKEDSQLATILLLLAMRIVRLEDDVRVLRAELARERIRETSEGKDETEKEN